MARIRALETFETSWPLPEAEWEYPDGKPAVRAGSATVKAGEEAELPDATAERLVVLGLAELV